MKHSRLKAIIAVLFALSGISGLMYEVAWSKYLSLFMGSTTYSHMIVLATFMGGLALGAFYWGKSADRSVVPLKLYGQLELVIGLYCFLYPFLMILAEKIFILVAAGGHLASNQILLILAKFFLSVLTLLLPAFCMGGTLPVLLKLLTRNINETGKEVAVLYWINSFGAVVGAALAGFFFIRLYSLDGTIWIAASVNTLVGLSAIMLARRIQSAAVDERHGGSAKPETVLTFPASVIRLAIAVAAVSGFISMIYELTWIRLLITLLGSSTYSFTVMLIAFISGITLGSWIVSRIVQRTTRLVTLLCLCQVGTAFFMLAMLPLYQRFPYYLWKLSLLLSNKPGDFPVFLFFEFLFCFLLMIAPTTFSGMSLPIVSRIATSNIKAVGRSIGGVFSVNTVGAVAGVLLTGLVFIPLLGIKQSLELGVLLNGVAGIAVLFSDAQTTTRWRILVTISLFLVGVGYKIAVPKWNEGVSSMGVCRAFFHAAPPSYDALVKSLEDRRSTSWYREGISANVAVSTYINDNGNQERALVVNGKIDASTESDLPTQILLAHIPLSLQPDTGEVLVIGMGSGITCGSALCHPIRSMDCVEISPEVLECNYLFENDNHRFLQDPRTHVFIDDALTFVKINPKRYSCIISEPSNPWIAGIGNLYTTEFFEILKQRLEPGGILAQWFHTYEVNDDVFQLVLRTLSRSFPHVMIWTTGSLDVVFTASMMPIMPQLMDVEHRTTFRAVADDLARIKVYDVAALLSTQITGTVPPSLVAVDGPVNSEKKPLLEFLAPISFFTDSHVGLLSTIDRRLDPTDTSTLLSQFRLRQGLSEANHLNIARFQSSHAAPDLRLAYHSVQECLKHNPNNTDALAILETIGEVTNLPEERMAAMQELIREIPDSPELIAMFAREFFAWKLQTDSSGLVNAAPILVQLLQRSIELSGHKNERYFIDIAAVLTFSGEYKEAADAYAYALNLRNSYDSRDTSMSNEQLAFLAAGNYLNAHLAAQADIYVERLKRLNPHYENLPDLSRKLAEEKKGAF